MWAKVLLLGEWWHDPAVHLRRYLVPALFLLACDDDDARGTVSLDGGPPIDTGTDTSTNPEPDASCETSMLTDLDHDGFSRAYGDCNDCDPLIGVGAYDFPGNGLDEDCSGRDATLADRSCDTSLEDDDREIRDALRAFGVCGEPHSTGSGRDGLITARFARIDPSKEGLADPRQVWLPEHFGVILPRAGQRLLALSTGVARDVDADDFTPACDVFDSEHGAAPPEGFPRDAKACGKKPISEGALAYDDVVLELTLRAPVNATAFAFDSLFLTHEYPDFVCSRYNDFFVVLMDPAPEQADDDDNILFDSEGDAIGVNSALLSVCERAEPQRVARDIVCSQGDALLKDTGYGAEESSCGAGNGRDLGGASTGWLRTEMPIRPGRTFTLRFVLWDSGDATLDSTVLLDNFRWLNTPPSGNTAPIGSLTSG
ncbi:MAG TPA: choice-of-anchor L domain-containing protein [Polyangiales bacterium]|nr:choice-of-anchor L domain-containing protein [Polyangiales bacterium]